MKKVLIVSDSHGSNYGVKSYTELLIEKNKGKVDITNISFPGISIKKINEQIVLSDNYDMIFLQIFNPDLHPRMPFRFLNYFKSRKISFIRDSLFSVPPKLSISYFLRLPFFIIRLITVRVMKKKEYYLDADSLIEETSKLVGNLKHYTKRLYILPPFKINKIIYGKFHNENVDYFQEHLRNEYLEYLILEDVLKYERYSKFYNYDFFHFNKLFHTWLTGLIQEYIELDC